MHREATTGDVSAVRRLSKIHQEYKKSLNKPNYPNQYAKLLLT